MEKKILMRGIEKLTPKEKDILENSFKNKDDAALIELIDYIKKGLSESNDREARNKLLNRLNSFFKKIIEDVEKSWKQALYDLEVASDLIRSSKYSASAFHSQQAVEMGLKAIYIYTNADMVQEHNLYKMAKILGLPDMITQKASKLNPIYTGARYFDARADGKIPAEQFDEDHANDYYNDAEEVLRWVSQKLNLSMN